MPNEKSSSIVSSKRFFCESVSTLYTSCLVSDGASSGNCSRVRWPCTRTCGGVAVAMCRSDPSISTNVFSSSGSVAITFLVPSCWQLVAPGLLDRFPHDLLDRREAVLDLAQAAHPEGDHPLLDRLAPQLGARGANQNQLLEFLANRHHFIEADASLVAGRIALVAAGALHRRDFVGVLGREAGLHQRLRRLRRRFLAVGADPPDEALRADQMNGAGDQERL